MNCTLGTAEPSIIPTGNALRVLKSKKLTAKQRHHDTLTTLAFMKKEDDYINVLHDMGFDPFFIQYYCPEQIHIYRNYCNSVKYPKLIIDATGSVVKPFIKLGMEMTNQLFLYEGLVYDAQKNQNFTATNMISERHTNIAISNWLLKWSSSGIKKPKETVCDQSLALISAIIQSFTQFSSIQEYVRVCSDLLTGKINLGTHFVPLCFVRIDVAHFIKTSTKWAPLKSISRRVREIILRTVGLLIKCQNIIEVRSLLSSLFIVLTNETDGIDQNSGQNTPCEIHKQSLIKATSTGFIEFQQQFDNILATVESEDERRMILEEEFERQNDGLDDFENPFQSWANTIYESSKCYIKEGTGINPLYLPTLVPILIRCMKFLPLWLRVMIPIFGYGDDISSSAAEESSFNKLKTVTMKHVNMPTKIEIFLENHIKSLKGASLLREARNNNINIEIFADNNVNNKTSSPASKGCFNKDARCLNVNKTSCV